MAWSERITVLYLAALGLPFAALGALALAWLAGLPLRERLVARTAITVTSASFLAAAVATLLALGRGLLPLEAGPWPWFSAGSYVFAFSFRWDAVSVTLVLGSTLLCGLVASFSARYLHREPGHTRYFVLLLLFAGAMQLLVASGGYDQLFMGWELVGLTSVLLVAFYHDRPVPVRAAIRVMISYRLCDLGLLFGAVLMHHAGHGTGFGHLDASALSPGMATAIALSLLVGASGKAAQLPFGGWLPRAMEGPTPSTALFYGALSVHAGIYLLIRSAPLFEVSTVASVAAVVVGALTALYGAGLSRVQSDAKTQLAYASMAQLGVMVVTVGLHFPTLALLHLVGHASLRGYQMLRAPSLMADTIELRKALGLTTLAIGTEQAPRPLYRALRDGLYVDLLAERYVVRAVLALGRASERWEQAWTRVLDGGPPDDTRTAMRKPDAVPPKVNDGFGAPSSRREETAR